MPNPKSKRLPRARVETYFISKIDRRPYITRHATPLSGVPIHHCALLPATAKRARLLCKAWNNPGLARHSVESILIEANYLAFKRNTLGQQVTDTEEQTRDYVMRILAALGFADKGAE